MLVWETCAIITARAVYCACAGARAWCHMSVCGVGCARVHVRVRGFWLGSQHVQRSWACGSPLCPTPCASTLMSVGTPAIIGDARCAPQHSSMLIGEPERRPPPKHQRILGRLDPPGCERNCAALPACSHDPRPALPMETCGYTLGVLGVGCNWWCVASVVRCTPACVQECGEQSTAVQAYTRHPICLCVRGNASLCCPRVPIGPMHSVCVVLCRCPPEVCRGQI